MIRIRDIDHSGAAPGTQDHNVDHVCYRVGPFDAPALRAPLASLGIEAGATETRFGAEGEEPSFYLSDPQGNVVELKGPPSA